LALQARLQARMNTPKYGIGIDLGTSNCALAFASLEHGADAPIQHLPIPQWTRPGEYQARAILPSCVYLPGEHELAHAAIRLPWDSQPDCVLGEFARWQGARVPGRLVFSAKSWLCHDGVDRSARFLPWGGPEELRKISPVEASARLLKYLFNTWDAAHPEAPLIAQEVVITVPASFDEAARSLTVQAARQAGLERFTLLEEPQAAFYDFTALHRTRLQAELDGVRLALVIDVGGGTTDFSLMGIETSAAGPLPRRLAVGDHLLLGGDNMDATLARHLEAQLTAQGRRLSAIQWHQLLQSAREAKESLLGSQAVEKCGLSVAAEGSQLFGGTRSAVLSRAEAEKLILEGFLPFCDTDASVRRGKRSAIHELGLPYEQDPAITRHLVDFLRQHAPAARKALGLDEAETGVPRPDAILLNGGVFYSTAISQRLIEVVSAWWPGRPPVRLLKNDALDIAVARGAAYYTLARRGQGPRIAGGAAHSLYIGLGSRTAAGVGAALCVVPQGSEEGSVAELSEQNFQLTLGRPVQFPLYSSTVDRAENSGSIVAVTEDLRQLPPLHAVLTSAQNTHPTVTVHLKAGLTEIGTLELWCVDTASQERWRLEFELRGKARHQLAIAEAMPGKFGDAREWVERLYPGKKTSPTNSRQPASGPKDVRQLWSCFEQTLGPREQWRLPLLRELWTVLHAGAAKRRRSVEQEKVFFQLCGYCLRPGFGYPLDDWRCEQVFALFDEGVEYHKEKAVWTEYWVLWRRLSGGLSEEAQLKIWDYIKPRLEQRMRAPLPKHAPKPKGIQPEGWDEMVRVAASLEHLPVVEKVLLGTWVAEHIVKTQVSGGPWAWALGRVGARVPLSGSGHRTVPPEQVEAWLDMLLARGLNASDGTLFAATQLARLTGDRSRDLGDSARGRVLAALHAAQAPEMWRTMVMETTELTREDEARAIGDSLPVGLVL
jgi:molecular chaperone DnaK (HSP70)